jgi:hypothetical protein
VIERWLTIPGIPTPLLSVLQEALTGLEKGLNPLTEGVLEHEEEDPSLTE